MYTWLIVVGVGLMWVSLLLLMLAIALPHGFPASNRTHVPTHDEIFAVPKRGEPTFVHPGDHDA